jgi:hypothetical protein
LGDNDVLTMGSILLGAGVMAVGLLALLFRHPQAPRWTRPELVAMLAVIPVTGVLGFGGGYTLFGAYRLLHGTGHLYELAAPFGVALAVAALWHALAIPRRLRFYGSASVPAGFDPAAAPTLIIEAPPRQPPTSPAPRTARRAA